MKKLWMVAMIAAAATACTEDENASISWAQTPAQIGETNCGKIFECCDDTERAEILQFFAPNATTADECVTEYTTAVTADEDFTEVQKAIDEGRVIYNGEAAASCIASLKAANCNTVFNEGVDNDDCDKVMTGTVDVGGTCVVDEECKGEANCEEGTCAVEPGMGEACPDFSCADGLYCNDESVCVAEAKAGEACSGFGSCEEGLYCDDASSTCMTQKAGGEACASLFECESFECENDVCAAVDNNYCDGQ